MLDGIEKQRKILSANLEATLHLECLLEDEDLHRSIKRTEFEELIAPEVDIFTNVLKEALALSGKFIRSLIGRQEWKFILIHR